MSEIRQELAICELGHAKQSVFYARAHYRLTGQPITDKRLLLKFDQICGEIEKFQRELSQAEGRKPCQPVSSKS